MPFSRRRRFKRRHPKHSNRPSGSSDLVRSEEIGSEPAYLKSLIDSRAKVTVVLKSGERFRGHIRYYDRDCFSVGLSSQGPRIFLRKASVSYIAED